MGTDVGIPINFWTILLLLLGCIVMAVLTAQMLRGFNRSRGVPRECPFCAATVPADAWVCEHCGRDPQA